MLASCCCLVAKLCLTLLTPWTVAHQAPLSVGYSRQKYWSGLSSSPGDLLHPGIKRASPALADSFFTTAPPGKPQDTFHFSVHRFTWRSHRFPLYFLPLVLLFLTEYFPLSFLFHHQGGNHCRLAHQDYNPPFPCDKHGGSLNFSLL